MNADEPNTVTTVTHAKSLFKFRPSSTLRLALLFFTIAGSAILVALPWAFGSGVSHPQGQLPPFALFLVSGLLMILLTVGLFAYLSRKLGWRSSAVQLAIGYNAVLVIIKFCLSPLAMYYASQHGGLADTFNPNSIIYFILAGLIVLLIYVIAFRMLYALARRQYSTATGTPHTVVVVRLRTVVTVLLVGGGLVLLGGAVVVVPLLLLGAAWEYLAYVLGALGGPIIIAAIMAIVLAFMGFKDVEEQAVSLRNPALLASFFWIGLSLILLYHVMWVVFMVTLVQLWPFNTYSTK